MAEPLVTVDELAAFLRRDLDESDVLAVLACEGASDELRRVTDQTLSLVEDDTVVFSGDGSSFNVLLPELPVLDVDEVRVDGETYLDWTLRRGGILVSTDGKWPEGDANIEVDYTHGYVVDGSSINLPAELRIVALTVAARIYHQGLVRQETTGGVSTTYSTPGPVDLTSGERYLLAKYKVDRQDGDEIEQTPEVS